jgi:hypothetical protein
VQSVHEQGLIGPVLHAKQATNQLYIRDGTGQEVPEFRIRLPGLSCSSNQPQSFRPSEFADSASTWDSWTFGFCARSLYTRSSVRVFAC